MMMPLLSEHIHVLRQYINSVVVYKVKNLSVELVFTTKASCLSYSAAAADDGSIH